MLKIKDVKKYFDRRLVLEIFQLDLEKDMYWVKGENGSGKSTFLRMIAGVLPFDGQICFEDINVKRRSFGVLSDSEGRNCSGIQKPNGDVENV